jgi:hypothetical protein
MNLIDATPKIVLAPEVLRAFLDHRRDVLIRRSTRRMVDRPPARSIELYHCLSPDLDRVINVSLRQRGADGPKVGGKTRVPCHGRSGLCR